MSASGLRLRAFAKINWSLEVLGGRPDGYHEIRTILQTVSLADDVELYPRPDLERHLLSVTAPPQWDVPSGPENLAGRALSLLSEAQRAGVETHFELRLNKKIPPAAGLGGGSSDAAAVLRAVWEPARGLQLDPDRLGELAARLGSDVPFFLRGGTQVGAGRGERLERLPDVPETWIVLLLPPIAIEQKTRRMYSLLAPACFSDGTRTATLAAAIAAGRAPRADDLYNVFDGLAEQAFPGLERYRRALQETCGLTMLCGAGPSLFAPCPSRDLAEEAAAALAKRQIPTLALRTVAAVEATAVAAVGE